MGTPDHGVSQDATQSLNLVNVDRGEDWVADGYQREAYFARPWFLIRVLVRTGGRVRFGPLPGDALWSSSHLSLGNRGDDPRVA